MGDGEKITLILHKDYNRAAIYHGNGNVLDQPDRLAETIEGLEMASLKTGGATMGEKRRIRLS